jgi:hypothetical protein
MGRTPEKQTWTEQMLPCYVFDRLCAAKSDRGQDSNAANNRVEDDDGGNAQWEDDD